MPGHGIQRIREYDSEFRLLDMQVRYDSSTVYETMERLGPAGRRAYRDYLVLDFVFIACLLVVMLTITNVLYPPSIMRTIGLAASIMRAVFDISENIMLLFMIRNWPVSDRFLPAVCSWSTTLKFLMLYAWCLIVLYRLLSAAVRNFGSG